jgi:D-alanyl-D-alanine carboxypeptidase (penicillin-binding protein 5/6)
MSQPSRFLPSSGVVARRAAQRRARVRRRAIVAMAVAAVAGAVVIVVSGARFPLGGGSPGRPAPVAARSPLRHDPIPGVGQATSPAADLAAAPGVDQSNGAGTTPAAAAQVAAPAAAAAAATALGAPGATQLALADANAVGPPFKAKPRAGILFDIDTGRVLWQRDATSVLPIASLTKMMTALLVVRNAPAAARVLITRQAIDYHGSGVGELPLGRHVRLESLLYGLLLPSGNDAAIALAQHISGTLPRFVALMNATARQLGLGCTHYVSPDGIEDANVSCPADLARLARIVLAQPRLARIVGSASAIIPFPIKGHKLYLYNNNPLLRSGFPGITGLKTGETDAAGLCLVATARRGNVRIGSVLLHAPNPADLAHQSAVLLNAGFDAEHG